MSSGRRGAHRTKRFGDGLVAVSGRGRLEDADVRDGDAAESSGEGERGSLGGGEVRAGRDGLDEHGAGLDGARVGGARDGDVGHLRGGMGHEVGHLDVDRARARVAGDAEDAHLARHAPRKARERGVEAGRVAVRDGDVVGVDGPTVVIRARVPAAQLRHPVQQGTSRHVVQQEREVTNARGVRIDALRRRRPRRARRRHRVCEGPPPRADEGGEYQDSAVG